MLEAIFVDVRHRKHMQKEDAKQANTLQKWKGCYYYCVVVSVSSVGSLQ